LWCLIYFGACALWYALFGGGPTEPLKARVLAVLFLLSTYALFVQGEGVVRCVRYVLLACVVVGAVVNVYDISHPFALVPATSEFAKLGRAAGFYINPNQAGLALLLGLVLTVDLCPPRLRPPYVLLVLIGVVLTGSRSAIVGALITIFLLVRSGSLRQGQVYSMAAVLSLFGVLTWASLTNTVATLDLNALYDRLAWFSTFGSNGDFSQQERIVLAEKAWALFEAHPFLGAGLGATEVWSERAPAHNMYLLGMTDFGVVGALIFPALVVSCAGGLRPAFERSRAPFVYLALWGGLFSHNLIGEHYFMIGLGVMAALTEQETRQALEWSARRYATAICSRPSSGTAL
jgi:hypothetical protein